MRLAPASTPRRAVIEVLGQELGLDLLAPFLREREEVLRRLVAAYDPLAAMSREGEPDEDGFAPSDRALPLPRGLRLPPIELERLEPDPGEVERLRAALAVLDPEAWWMTADELGVVGAMGDADAELKERVRRRGRELGCLNRALDELVAEGAGDG